MTLTMQDRSTSKQIEAEIEQLKDQIGASLARFEELHAEFASALPGRVDTWMRGFVEQRIADNARAVNNAGIEPLRRLKVGLNAIADQLPEICRRAAGPVGRWPHHIVPVEEQRPPRLLAEESFRKALDRVAALLAEYSFIGIREGRFLETQQAGKFTHEVGFDAKHFPSLKSYEDALPGLAEDRKRLEVMRGRLEVASALELWDQA